MTRTRVFGAIATILCLVSLGTTSVRGQWVLEQGGSLPPEWQYVGSLGDAHHPVPLYSYTASYFFGPRNSVVANAFNGKVTIYWLAPNVQTMGLWKVATVPAGLSYIRRFRFIQGKLYAASRGTDVLVSLDSGKTWTYSGLGLVDANDVYADGSGMIRALHDPMKVFARLDTLHCIAQGDANIFVSTDGGLNWISSGVPMVDSFSTGAFADPCRNVYVCPNSWGTAFRSTDFGSTWQTVLTGSGTNCEFVSGASTVVYLTDTLGMFRSTDDGLTWNSVITIDSGAMLPMFVWGPMGEHVAIACVVHLIGVGDYDVLLMTTTGGMDDLHGAPSMTDSNGAPLTQEDTMNVPLELASTCNPFLIPVTVESDVDSMTVRITMRDSLGDFAFPMSDSVIPLRIHHEDTVWMQYDPHHPVSNVVLSFENHWHCSDWSETRTVHVVAIPDARIGAPPAFAASCIADTEAALIRADSCDRLAIDSIYIPPYLRQYFLVTTFLPDTTWIGSNDSLRFAFRASGMSGTISDSIIVYGHYLGMDSLLNDYFYFPHAWGVDTDFSFFYTTLPISLRALAASNTLAARDTAIGVAPSYICNERDTFAIVRNVGCDTICISSIALQGTGFRIVAGGDSVCLASGARDTIWLATQVDTAGHPNSNTDSLLIVSTSGSPLAPVVLSHGINYPAPWNLALSPPDSSEAGQGVVYHVIQHGSLPQDVGSVDFQIVFDDDLLQLTGVDESWVSPPKYYRSSDGKAHYELHVAPVPTDSVIATLHLTAYQAKVLSTELTLDSIFLTDSAGWTGDCIASVTHAGSQFTLLTQCGTPEFAGFLKTGTVVIEAIDPDPAVGHATVSIYSNAGASLPGELSLVNDIGREMRRHSLMLAPGLNRIPLDLSLLPGGIYALRLRVAGLPSIKTFIKQ